MANERSGLKNEETQLCHRCKSIPATTFLGSGNPSIGAEYEFGPTEPYQLIGGSDAFKELNRSAEAGCGLCTLFQDALRLSPYDPDEQPRRQPEYCMRGIRLQRKSPDILEIAFGTTCSHQLDARLVILTDQSTARSIEPASYVIETESDSPANFALVRSWLAECCKEHVDCQDPLDFKPPTRLLDVAIPSKPGIIRLVLESKLDLKAHGRVDYAALSHCWGSFKPLQTGKKDLPSYMEEIPNTLLPETFHDAVRTTRELGLRYLWIDSLCIVQDHPEDREAECARMNTIFSNALCTISASDARDCRDGLFRSRTMKPIRLTYKSDGVEPDFTVIMQPTLCGSWMQGLKGPLQSRAWVLQERHLSPRIIHYTKKCLMWECRTAIASEHRQEMRAKGFAHSSNLSEFLHGMQGDVSAKIVLRSTQSPNRFLDGGRPKLGPEDTRSCLGNDIFRSLHDRWYRIVQDYSHRDLTKPEDRLPALSGFAAEWKRVKPEDEYFAGLWKSDIFKGLAWFPSPKENDIRRRLPAIDAPWPPSSRFDGIPSWSWAAFDGPVAHFGENWFGENFYDHDSRTSEVGQGVPTVTSCPLSLHGVRTTTIEKLNPFGRVSKGEIKVSSWSAVVTLSESDFSPGYLIASGDAPKAYRLHPDLRYVVDGMVYFDHDPFRLRRIEVRLLQLGKGQSIRGSLDCVCGLALLQVQTEKTTPEKDLYRRVGMFELNDYPFWLSKRERKIVTII